MAYPRALLERLGGFDESFAFRGEDTDLAYRALEAGAEPVFFADAVVHHTVLSLTMADALGAATRWDDPVEPAYLLADCGRHVDLATLLGPLVARTHEFGCASVYEVGGGGGRLTAVIIAGASDSGPRGRK